MPIFACAEIAVISSNETRIDKLAEQGNKPAKRLQALQNRPAQFLATIQVAHYAFRLFGQCLCPLTTSQKHWCNCW